MTDLHRIYVRFAEVYGIAPAVAYVLPALFECSAQKVGMTTRELATSALGNHELGKYLAQCARDVANADLTLKDLESKAQKENGQ